jgi:lysyl-tRNA synthetase class I
LLTVYESVSHVVDYALKSATEAQKKTSKEADEKFKSAIEALTAYEKKFHLRKTVAERMTAAEAKDKSSSTILNKLREKLRVRGLQ